LTRLYLITQVLGPCLEEMKQLQNAVEAEEEASPARASAEQELKLYMQVCASTNCADLPRDCCAGFALHLSVGRLDAAAADLVCCKTSTVIDR